MVHEITDHTFEKEVMQENHQTVLAVFSAPWCGPCRAQAPILEQFAAENADIKVCKINTDLSEAAAVTFAVRGVPALFTVKNGQVVNKAAGVQSLDALKKMTDL
ncbi:MAG: thioredoxin family protein [Firmicutes bacterium]|nr:thioredoxin family protein [Bacillota bacterium]